MYKNEKKKKKNEKKKKKIKALFLRQKKKKKNIYTDSWCMVPLWGTGSRNILSIDYIVMDLVMASLEGIKRPSSRLKRLLVLGYTYW